MGEIDDEEERRVAGIEDEWLFDQIPRPKEEIRGNKKEQDI